MTKRTAGTGRKAATIARMTADIPSATAAVLAKRVPMLLTGALDPNKRNRREEQEMVAEKVTAGIEAGQAMAATLLGGSMAIAGALWQAMAAPLPLAKGKQARGKRSAAGAWQNVAQKTLNTALATTEAALRPAHRKVTANARRLSSRKP